MADENNSQNLAEDGEGEAGAKAEKDVKPESSLLKKIILLLIPLLLAGGGAGLYFSGMLDSLLGKENSKVEEKKDEAAELKEIKYVDVPELLINLNGPQNSNHFLKLALSIELKNDLDANQMKTLLPRLTDQYTVYLRQLRIEDLKGSIGIQRLREELLRRTNDVSTPIKAQNILFKTMIVQ